MTVIPDKMYILKYCILFILPLKTFQYKFVAPIPYLAPITPAPRPVVISFLSFNNTSMRKQSLRQRHTTTITTTPTTTVAPTTIILPTEKQPVPLAFEVAVPMPLQMAIPAIPPPSYCLTNGNYSKCPPCPPCLCAPSCTPSFFSYCSVCHQKCRCRNPEDAPSKPSLIPPIPYSGPAYPMPIQQIVFATVPRMPQIPMISTLLKQRLEMEQRRRQESDDDSSDSDSSDSDSDAPRGRLQWKRIIKKKNRFSRSVNNYLPIESDEKSHYQKLYTPQYIAVIKYGENFDSDDGLYLSNEKTINDDFVFKKWEPLKYLNNDTRTSFSYTEPLQWRA